MPTHLPAVCLHQFLRRPAIAAALLVIAIVLGDHGTRSAHADESLLSINLQRVLDEVRANAGRQGLETQSTLPETAAAGTASLGNPRAGQPMRFVHINPRAAAGGNGSYERPFRSLAEFEQLPASVRNTFDVIYVHGGGPQQITNTLQLDSHQRLLSTSVPHTVTAAQGTFALPGYNAASAPPTLLNLNGGDIVALGHANEVSGFRFNGSSTGSGIVGTNVAGFNINRNEFVGGLNGVALTTTAPGGVGVPGILSQNTFDGHLNDGFQLTHVGPGRLDLHVADNVATGSTGTAFSITADGSSMRATIVGNRASGNGTGLTLNAVNGGQIDATVEDNVFEGSTGTTGARLVGRGSR